MNRRTPPIVWLDDIRRELRGPDMMGRAVRDAIILAGLTKASSGRPSVDGSIVPIRLLH